MMIHYLEDNNKEAKAFIDSEDGELFVSVCICDKQYDFGLDEKELELIRFLINFFQFNSISKKCQKE